MPFGAVFAVILFGAVVPFVSWRLLGASAPDVRASSAALMVLSLCLAAGLALRRSWARWAGLAGCALAALGCLELQYRGGVVGLVGLLACFVAFVLLLVPPTGRFLPLPFEGPVRVWSGRVLAVGAAGAMLTLVGVNVARGPAHADDPPGGGRGFAGRQYSGGICQRRGRRGMRAEDPEITARAQCESAR